MTQPVGQWGGLSGESSWIRICSFPQPKGSQEGGGNTLTLKHSPLTKLRGWQGSAGGWKHQGGNNQAAARDRAKLGQKPVCYPVKTSLLTSKSCKSGQAVRAAGMEIQREVSQGDTARPSPKEKGCEEGGEGTGQGTPDRGFCAQDENRILL